MPFPNKSLGKRIVLLLDKSSPLLELTVELFLFEVHGYMEEEYISEQIIVLSGIHRATKSVHYISK